MIGKAIVKYAKFRRKYDGNTIWKTSGSPIQHILRVNPIRKIGEIQFDDHLRSTSGTIGKILRKHHIDKLRKTLCAMGKILGEPDVDKLQKKSDMTGKILRRRKYRKASSTIGEILREHDVDTLRRTSALIGSIMRESDVDKHGTWPNWLGNDRTKHR